MLCAINLLISQSTIAKVWFCSNKFVLKKAWMVCALVICPPETYTTPDISSSEKEKYFTQKTNQDMEVRLFIFLSVITCEPNYFPPVWLSKAIEAAVST
jgi:hypothetical protein